MTKFSALDNQPDRPRFHFMLQLPPPPFVLEPPKHYHFNIYYQLQEIMAPALEKQVDLSPAASPNLSAPQTPVTGLPHPDDRYIRLGLEGVEWQEYRSTRLFRKAIDLQTDELRSGNAGQYAVFAPVTIDQLATIGRIRDRDHKSLRFLYLHSERALIVKISPGLVHGLAKRRLASVFNKKVVQMGLDNELAELGCVAFEGRDSSKEADCTWIPAPDYGNFPALVIECGISGSAERLEMEAGWWLDNLGGEVKVVLVISISQADRKVSLDQWELATAPNPEVSEGRSHPTIAVPTKTGHVEIVDGMATGAPLRLDFKKIFHSDPGEGQGDIVFTKEDIEGYAAHVWRFSQ